MTPNINRISPLLSFQKPNYKRHDLQPSHHRPVRLSAKDGRKSYNVTRWVCTVTYCVDINMFMEFLKFNYKFLN